MSVDFSKIKGPGGLAVKAAYQYADINSHWILCKLSDGKWAFYPADPNDTTIQPHLKGGWHIFNGQQTFDDNTILGNGYGGWNNAVANGPTWTQSVSHPNPNNNKVQTKEAPCICSSRDIFNFGCPAARGLRCRTEEENEAKAKKDWKSWK